MSTSKRIAYISCLQILGTALVILYHSFEEYPGEYGALPPLLLFQSVRMPLFTFISGFLFMLSWQKPGRYASARSFIAVKAQRLLLPFLVLQTLAFLPRSLMSALAEDDVALSLESFIRSLIFTDDMTVRFLWFLPMIFTVLTAVYMLLQRWRQSPGTFLAVGIAVASLSFLCFTGKEIHVLGLGRLSDLTLFFLLGMAYARVREQTDRCLRRWWQGAIYAAIWIGTFILFDTGTRPMQLLLSLSGLGAMLCVAHYLSRVPKVWRWFEGYNYYMYLLSWFTCVASQQMLHHFTDFPWWVYTAVAFLSSLLLPTLIGRMLQRNAPRSRAARIVIRLLGHNPDKFKEKADASVSVQPAAGQPGF